MGPDFFYPENSWEAVVSEKDKEKREKDKKSENGINKK
jgi:hypothetical protein